MTATHEAGHPRRWPILGVLIFALFGISLDNTVLNIALPTLARDLAATTAQLQWIVDAYMLVFAGLLLVAGALSDRYGRRLLLVLGLGLFGIGSAIAPFVSSAEQLIVLRGFMGLGAALTMPSTLSIIAEVFSAPERPKAIAAWGSVSALGIVVGPILGGWLLEHFPWASVFVVNIPFAVGGIVATLLVVPESRSPRKVALDPIGAGLSVVGLVSLVYGIIEIPSNGWTAPVVVASLGAAALLLGIFLAWEQRVDHPMLDVRLFADRRFSAASLSVTLVFFSLMGAMFFLTQYLQIVRGLSALETGMRFIPIAVGVILTAPFTARLTVRFGPRLVTTVGLLVIAAGLGLEAFIDLNSGDVFISAVMIVIAAGMGLAMTPATEAIMSALPRGQFGVGSAVNDTVREIGASLGVAVLGSLFAGSYAEKMTSVAAGLPSAARDVVTDSLAGAAAVSAQLGGATGQAIFATARASFVDAMAWTALIGVAFAVAGAVVAFVFMPPKSAVSADAEAAAGEAETQPDAVAFDGLFDDRAVA